MYTPARHTTGSILATLCIIALWIRDEGRLDGGWDYRCSHFALDSTLTQDFMEDVIILT